ncbi:hypothetical protein [Fibrella aquatilis]|uniref:Uncharacterized protein n=1 Tax=Fibrella aquatilis TaxID=2817059 RepID=A0A939K297_9BACT|nr:hypothetical protein [Fibrella aquatilis]MBO0933866.1 hypothetical protein [Fibrella aquatilis]
MFAGIGSDSAARERAILVERSPPRPKHRIYGAFKDPAQDRRVIDYFTAQQQVGWSQDAFYYLKSGWLPISMNVLDHSAEQALRAGTSGTYSYDFDLSRIDFAPYRAVVFMNVYALTNNDFTYANNGLLLLHTKDGGPRTLHLRSGKNLSLTIPAASTYLPDSQVGDILMK